MTPVEERIDHAEAREIAETAHVWLQGVGMRQRMCRLSEVEGAILRDAYLALLTERSARPVPLKDIQKLEEYAEHVGGRYPGAANLMRRVAKALYHWPATGSPIHEALERLVADLETNSEAGAPDYAHKALALPATGSAQPEEGR